MSNERPRIGVPVDVKLIGEDPTHAVGEKYLAAVAHAAGTIPLLLPALIAGAEMPSLTAEVSADDLLDGLDGLFLTGSQSNMDPHHYASSAPGVGPFDSQRDSANLALLHAAIARDMPIFAVCRGYQELNVACGGTLHTAVHDVPGFNDHRADHERPRPERYAPAHPVRLVDDGLLARLTGEREVMVNSLHGQGIDRLADSLIAEATAPDGLIEAVRHRHSSFTIGVQWHPEWRYTDNPVSMALFVAFGDAARVYRRAHKSG
ncbi:MAG: gamma-glutamyl-gamma-aminobutyrate hydrolase family protein [Salinisphaera sp.]|jgi:putative glutamine amidotransferase|nr:gamma-glutamyl-gamma-aminobutyrate hydrolase family protein [Salinisphaera sp.]